MSQGFRDWQLSEQFNCNASNPYPERCGVPFSCCRKSVVSEAAGSLNPLLQSMRSLECWQNAQTKRIQEIEADIYVRGCLQPLRTLFEGHAVHLGAVVAGIILPVVCCRFSNPKNFSVLPFAYLIFWPVKLIINVSYSKEKPGDTNDGNDARPNSKLNTSKNIPLTLPYIMPKLATSNPTQAIVCRSGLVQIGISRPHLRTAP